MKKKMTKQVEMQIKDLAIKYTILNIPHWRDYALLAQKYSPKIIYMMLDKDYQFTKILEKNINEFKKIYK